MNLLKGRNGPIGIGINKPPPGPRPVGQMNSLANPLLRDLILMVLVRTTGGEVVPLHHSHGSHWVVVATKSMTVVSPAYVVLEGGSCLEVKFNGPATLMSTDTLTIILSK